VGLVLISATVHNGSLGEKAKNEIKEFLKKNEGKLVHVTLSRKYHPKSQSQRGYYWGVMLPSIFNGTRGTTADYDDLQEIHEEMKILFLKIVPMRPDGTCMEEKVLSTEDLNQRETEEFHEQIRQFWIMRGVYIPLPNETDQVYLELV